MSVVTTTVLKRVLLIVIRATERNRPILPIIYIVTIGVMLNFNGGYNGHGLKTSYVNRPSVFFQKSFTQFVSTQRCFIAVLSVKPKGFIHTARLRFQCWKRMDEIHGIHQAKVKPGIKVA